MLLLAVVPERTFVRLHAAFRKFRVRLLLAVDHLHGLSDARRHLQVFILHHLLHVVDDKELLDVKCAMPHVVAVKANQICARDIDAALFQHPLLVSNIGCILLQLSLLSIELREAGALHFVDGPSFAVFAKNVNGTIAALAAERRFADVLHALVHILLCQFYHLLKIQAAVFLMRGHFLEVAKEPHRQVAHHVSLCKSSLHTCIYGCLFRLIHLQPEVFRALAESGVTRF